MIAVDTSTLIAFFAGDFAAKDVKSLQNAIKNELLILPPMVLSEILSVPNVELKIEENLKLIPHIKILPDFWIRVGKTRSYLLQKKLKAKLADAMIAQCCIDNKIALITRDTDFRHFAKHCGLLLI